MSWAVIHLDIPYCKLIREYSYFIKVNDTPNNVNYVLKLALEKYIPRLASAIEPSSAHKLLLSPDPVLVFQIPDGGETRFSSHLLQETKDKVAHIIHPHLDLFWLATESLMETVREVEIYPSGICSVYGHLTAPEPFQDHYVHLTLSRDSFRVTELKEDQRIELHGERANLPEQYDPLIRKCRIFTELPTWSELNWIATTKHFSVSFHTKGGEE